MAARAVSLDQIQDVKFLDHFIGNTSTNEVVFSVDFFRKVKTLEERSPTGLYLVRSLEVTLVLLVNKLGVYAT